MERLARMVQRTSLCGLGQGAPNPIFSTLRYFRDEYIAHIVDRTCPAGVCKMGVQAVTRCVVWTLKIDGADVAGADGETILSVALENGIDIPTMCHLDGLSDTGQCRLCVVEIAGSPKLAPACTTAVAEGMEIQTRPRRSSSTAR